MHRIVHFDLKGAPYTVEYLKQVIKVSKQWGATGILFEWEDTFPYTEGLEAIGSVNNCGGDERYTAEEVKALLHYTQKKEMVAIQLVQTIGHLEFVLKHPAFRSYRENPRCAGVLCPSKPQSTEIILTMINQALEMQPDAEYFHIGADEVWHIGTCDQCARRASINPHRISSLYLDHIQKIVLFIKHKRPNITILMWDDMLRTIHFDTLKAYKLGDLVEPVVWNYSPRESFHFDPEFWAKYKQLYPKIWAGSAFKGANGSCQQKMSVPRYVSNQKAWKEEFKKCEPNFKFSGIILTGWSRYDHYATLCELLPVAMPCLASCLRYLTKADNEVSQVSGTLPMEEWPGMDFASDANYVIALREKGYELINGDHVKTWMNAWQVRCNYSDPYHLDVVLQDAAFIESQLSSLQVTAVSQLRTLTGTRSTSEWFDTIIKKFNHDISELVRSIEHIVRKEPALYPVL